MFAPSLVSKSKVLTTFVISSAFFLAGCDALIRKAVDKSMESTTTEVSAIFDCPHSFAQILVFSESIKDIKEKPGNASLLPIFSTEKDAKLREIINEYEERIKKAQTPQTDEERIYPDTMKSRKDKETDRAQQEVYKSLEKNFPEYMQVCKQTVKDNYTECYSKFQKNIAAQYDCREFYKKRLYWSILKKAGTIAMFNEADQKKLKGDFEEPFEAELKRKAQKQSSNK